MQNLRLPHSSLGVLLLALTCTLVSCDDPVDDPVEVFYEVPVLDIVVDGDAGDWAGISCVASDPLGDDLSSFSGADAKELFVAQDRSGAVIYVMMSFWDGPPNPDLASQGTTDGDAGHPDVAMGYQVFWDDCQYGPVHHPCAELFARYDPNLSHWFEYLGASWAIPVAVVAAGEVLEFSFLATEIDTPATVDVKAHINTFAHSDQREMIPNHEAYVAIRFHR